MADGYFRLPRAIRDSGFWPKTRRYTSLEALIDLCLSARYGKTPGKEYVGGRMITIPTGGYMTSQVKLAKRWRWDEKTVRKFLLSLNALGILRIETKKGIDHGYTLITFENSIAYDGDQESEFSIDDEENSRSTPVRVPITEDSKRLRVSRKGQYIGDSEDLSEGIPKGVSLRDRVESALIDNPRIAYLELVENLREEPSLTEINGLRKLTPDELRRVTSDIEAGQSVTVALLKVTAVPAVGNNTAAASEKGANDG